MKRSTTTLTAACLGLLGNLALAGAAPVTQASRAAELSAYTQPGSDAATSALLHVPVSGLPFGSHWQNITNPVAKDPQAMNRGQIYFTQFNCVGCHAPNGAGGMGPALSNHMFIYGAAPGQIYLSILQGRPNGMPSFGGKLQEGMIWDLVAYVQSISKDPQDPWDNTVSPTSFDTEQVPAEAEKTTDPWSYVESFSSGRAPNQHGSGAYPSTGRGK